MNMEPWIFNVMKMENVSAKVQLLVTSVIIVLQRHMIFQIVMVSGLANGMAGIFYASELRRSIRYLLTT